MVRSGNCCRSTEIISPASRTMDGVPLPRQSRNRTGRHTGCERNGNSTTIPTMIHRLPRPSALGSCAEPSWVQYAPNTRRPQRRNRVSSTTTSIGASASSSLVTISRASARPSRSASQACAEKNRQHAWNDTTAAMPAPASMPTTVRLAARATKPVASSSNNANVDDRRNAGRNVSNRTRHEAGRVRPGSIGGTPSRG